MNIVYLIGNGFDRNLGLKTSYQDFYRFYKTQVSNNENVQKVKEMISSQQSDLWSDLEIALGQISKEFNNTDAFIDVLKDISVSSSLYFSDSHSRNRDRSIGFVWKSLYRFKAHRGNYT